MSWNLTPDDIRALQAIQKQLKRKGITMTVAVSGKGNTAPYVNVGTNPARSDVSFPNARVTTANSNAATSGTDETATVNLPVTGDALVFVIWGPNNVTLGVNGSTYQIQWDGVAKLTTAFTEADQNPKANDPMAVFAITGATSGNHTVLLTSVSNVFGGANTGFFKVYVLQSPTTFVLGQVGWTLSNGTTFSNASINSGVVTDMGLASISSVAGYLSDDSTVPAGAATPNFTTKILDKSGNALSGVITFNAVPPTNTTASSLLGTNGFIQFNAPVFTNLPGAGYRIVYFSKLGASA